MFKRQSDNVFYYMWGDLCCFCSGGASANVSRATTATGPFTGNSPSSIIGANVHAQALGALELTTTAGLSYCYMGDRWQSTPDGIKGHDFIYISEPMTFDAGGNVAALAGFTNSFSVNLAAGAPSAGPVVAKNLAKGKTVSSSSSVETGGWGRTYLTDGRNFSELARRGFSSNDTLTRSHIEWVSVDLGSAASISNVKLFPRMSTNGMGTCPGAIPDGNDGYYGGGFPVGFLVQASANNTNWTTVATVTNFANPGIAPKSWSFTPVSARYVRIYATALAAVGAEYRLQLAEIAVYAAPTVSINNRTGFNKCGPSIITPQTRLFAYPGRAAAGEPVVGIYFKGITYDVNGRKCKGLLRDYMTDR
jgi:hypothetical protein